jgi:hypothetical protein
MAYAPLARIAVASPNAVSRSHVFATSAQRHRRRLASYINIYHQHYEFAYKP